MRKKLAVIVFLTIFPLFTGCSSDIDGIEKAGMETVLSGRFNKIANLPSLISSESKDGRIYLKRKPMKLGEYNSYYLTRIIPKKTQYVKLNKDDAAKHSHLYEGQEYGRFVISVLDRVSEDDINNKGDIASGASTFTLYYIKSADDKWVLLYDKFMYRHRFHYTKTLDKIFNKIN